MFDTNFHLQRPPQFASFVQPTFKPVQQFQQPAEAGKGSNPTVHRYILKLSQWIKMHDFL